MRRKTGFAVRFTSVFTIVGMLLTLFFTHPLEAKQTNSVYDRLSRGERISQNKAYVTPSEPTVYLTFDDGPSRHTGDVLDILQEEGIHATFFVLGEAAFQHPELVQRIVEEGHAIGNHTYDHRYDSLYTNFDRFWEQVTRTDDMIQQATGVETRLLRAPGGTYTNFDPFYHYYLDQAGYEVYDWTVDSGDSARRNVPASEIVSNVKNGRLTHEVNVLMHDSSIHAETVKALPDIIQFYKEEGYVFEPLSESVRPVQQSLGNLQWVRSNTLAMHTRRLNRVGEFSKPAAEPYTLHVRMENVDDSLETLDQLLIDGRFYIPLRAWNDWRGGHIRWDQSSQTVSERFGTREIEWNLATGHVTVRGSARQPTDLIMHEDRIYVPIRELTEAHGLKIVEITLNLEKREIVLR